MTTTITKAQLTASLETATAEIEALRAQLAAQHAEQAAPAQAPDLQQTLWLTKDCEQRQTPSGKLEVRFGGRISRADKASGQRVYGAWKNFKAYGTAAAAILEIFSTDNRLAKISAFETTWITTGGKTCTDWIVLDVQPVERATPAAAPAAPVAAAQPQLFDPSQDIPS